MSSVKRKCHCLKREKTLAMPRHIIFFDTETMQEDMSDGSIKQKLKLGWACYYRRGFGRNLEKVEWCEFYSGLDFWAFVYKHTEQKRKLWVLARNLVFDFTIVEGWKYLRQVGFKLKFFHDEGTTSIISVRGRFGSIVFLDIMNWFVESLTKTGERIGIPKLKIDFKTCSDSYLSAYCKRDVEIELENFKQFMKFLYDNSISRLCYTKGSTAMAAYLLSHYHKRVYIHNNQEAIDLERNSYRGGRVECFYLGDLGNENYYVLDVNSLYPYVMCNNFYPVKYSHIIHTPDNNALYKILQSYSAVAQVLIDTNEPAYAVRRGRTIFPKGKFWIVLTTPELLYAFEHNHIIKVKEVVVYEQENIFKTYVDRFYKLRLKFADGDNREYEQFVKILLNSLYGKFGQKADVWKKIGECPNQRDRVETLFYNGEGRVRQIRYLLGEIFELKGYEESFNSFPAIPAHVSAYGRMYLYNLMKQAGVGNYFYCDTDSLIVNEVGLCNLQNQIDKKRLGGLRIEEVTNSLTIRGLKDYSTQTKKVIKGIRKNAIEIQTGVYEQQQWPSFKGLLRGKETEGYTVKTVTKILERKYTKGYVNPNGSVEPFVLDDSETFSALFL